MAVATAADLVAALRQYRLLQPDQLDDLARKLQGRSLEPRALAQKLIESGWLTPYQVNQLLQGRGQELVLGSYLLLERLGEGGMGAVFKARHITMDRIVALKLIRKDLLDSPQAVKRFHREIQSAAALNHPNIVLAYDADQSGGAHFLTMEYVEGTDLYRLVKEKGPLPVAQACDCIRQAAQGLQHAFERGLVHRDIKPHNLLLGKATGKTAFGVVKILDMGLARATREETRDDGSSALTQHGLIMGSVDYIAPEQAMNSHTVDTRADLYSLGCTFYFLLTGRVPFPGGDAIGKVMKHKLDEPVPAEKIRPDVPPAVALIVRKLMAKDPAKRFQTPAELAAALAGGVPVLARAIQPPTVRAVVTRPSVPTATPMFALPASPRAARRGKRRLLAPLVAAGFLLGIVVLYLGFTSRPATQPEGSHAGKGPTPAATEADRVITNSVGMRLVWISPGKFLMGTSADDIERIRKEPNGGYSQQDWDRQEAPQHEVRITRGFYLGAFEVTQGQYEKVTGTNPSANRESPDHPVERVNWDDAVEFCRKLSATPEERKAGRSYRLPTEAEWEYACRAGTTTLFHYGNTLSFLQANIDGEHPFGPVEKGPRRTKTVKVGSYAPNAWGLYDMHGNVWEWCLDGPRVYTGKPASDPRGPDSATDRVLRGGGCFRGAVRAAFRKERPASVYRVPDGGFRVLCER